MDADKIMRQLEQIAWAATGVRQLAVDSLNEGDNLALLHLLEELYRSATALRAKTGALLLKSRPLLSDA
jgi:hypothetical protein